MPEVLKRVGRYDLLDVIGRGGAAVVYLAHQRDLRRHVALKELAPFHAADASFAERFVEESRLAGSMSHANVVTMHEYFEDGGVPYIAMEYLPNGSLRQYIGRLSIAQIAGVLEGVLAGLSHGEVHGIVHRDLKPENLLVASDGRVKIADFGVARALNKAATRAVVTVAGTTIGTPTYMSPEQALGAELTPATDLYSLGVVAWEMLAGQVPFEETDTPVAVLYRHVHETVPSVLSVAPDVDPALAAWLDRMLAKAPEDRYPSADAAWVELEDVVLELLGPRWRRQARLAVEAAAPPSQGQKSLTPADFSAEGSEDSEPAADTPATGEFFIDPPEVGPDTPEPGPVKAPAAETLSGARAASAPETTIAPRERPQRSNTTMMRIARRHHDAGEETGDRAPDAMRRRLAAAAIVVAMAAAIAGGLALAESGGKAGPSAAAVAAARRAAAERAEVAATNKKLAGVMSGLAVSRNRGLAALNNAGTPDAQASAATTVRHSYSSAAKRVAAFAGDSPAATTLSSDLDRTAGAYRRLAAAARAGRQKAYNGAAAEIRADERALQAEVAKL